ncbi:MAG: tripartite tricarboxylate transporter substrate binding protein [Betaproteobacteria bacterium]|nr:tripartite tricarboxylate transporter substrate binding protein [Betaproteobacteria bacterium]
MKSNTSVICIAGLLALGVTPAIAQTQSDYPTRPLRLIVPYFPGGTPDLQGRALGEQLRTRLNQPVVIDNRPGANGSIGTGIVARAPADGYTLLIAPVGPWVVNAYLYKLPYDLRGDLAPVIQVSSVPAILAVSLGVPAHSVKDLIALARQKPGELNYASAGIGGFGHTSGALFCVMTGVNMTHIPHKGAVGVLTDLAGGHVQVSFNVSSSTLPFVKAGRVRALATTGKTRFEHLPDLPTIAETVPGYENLTWNGVGVPARTPAAVIERLNREIAAILKMPQMQETARVEAYTIVGGTPAELAAHLKSEHAKYARLIKEAGIKGVD